MVGARTLEVGAPSLGNTTSATVNIVINFLPFHQGTSVTVAMDQTRQAIQLCGKLLFAQMSEILNVKMSSGLPPNLNGSDISLGKLHDLSVKYLYRSHSEGCGKVMFLHLSVR